MFAVLATLGILDLLLGIVLVRLTSCEDGAKSYALQCQAFWAGDRKFLGRKPEVRK